VGKNSNSPQVNKNSLPKRVSQMILPDALPAGLHEKTTVTAIKAIGPETEKTAQCMKSHATVAAK